MHERQTLASLHNKLQGIVRVVYIHQFHTIYLQIYCTHNIHTPLGTFANPSPKKQICAEGLVEYIYI
ncbi:hypothetical protein XELAEV_18025598mg [Xenopus laevis]|uniref:Uncharacterized protein n=1 Tax=Xenopus laevis TaxID=8355 RepID=A0A974HM91_XENLA|nr:hypothetical protein XELAEV_18025598mg [Xenopus laevis]